eukprot:g7744.t1
MTKFRHLMPHHTSTNCGTLSNSEACLSIRGLAPEQEDKEVVDEYFRDMSQCWVQWTSNARTELWMSILDEQENHSKASLEYYKLLEIDISINDVEAIEKDLDRTFPNFELFTIRNGQQSMKSILHAYAAYDPEVGYCQGMNFLVGLLLFYLPQEEDAFEALVFLMHKRGFRDLYTTSMDKLHMHLWQLGQLMPKSLTSHLESLGVLPVLFAPPWFMTCFAASFPIEIAARVLDAVFCNDSSTVMLKFAYSLITSSQECISSMNSAEDILEYLNCSLPNRKISELHELVTQSSMASWTAEQRSVVESVSVTESVYDSILRVEDALSSEESMTPSDESNTRRRKHHSFKRTIPQIARFLSKIVNTNVKRLSELYKSSPLQQILKKFQF